MHTDEELPVFLHPMAKRYESLAERIIANTVIDFESWYDGQPCWIWIASTNGQYGKMSLRWKRGPRKGQVYKAFAHRMAIVAFKGLRMTPRMVAKHLCNNPLCCNPHHLRGGSQKSNVRQCVREGRHYTPFRKENVNEEVEA